ncbi:hypothetical protein [Bathymodiolus thermophilus thioautotrophic gill symbiont]|nr:hypothetical protein [Bathymodiolus thermophilus thioautotrophic gill symbiont]
MNKAKPLTEADTKKIQTKVNSNTTITTTYIGKLYEQICPHFPYNYKVEA